jgi:hypothetical protein
VLRQVQLSFFHLLNAVCPSHVQIMTKLLEHRSCVHFACMLLYRQISMQHCSGL